MTDINDAVKTALRISTDAFDDEINALIESAKIDLTHAGVSSTKASDDSDPLTRLSIIQFCKMNFGEPTDYDRIKASYDELKKQLGMASDYTEYEAEDGQE